MGECGCATMDRVYSFPGPGKSIYLLRLSGCCTNCDAPSGVTVERIDPDNILYREYKRGEYSNGKLKFENWPDSKGVAVVTGLRRHEWIKTLLAHLVGVDSRELGGDDGTIDEAGADVILDEMYEDSQVCPKLATEK